MHGPLHPGVCSGRDRTVGPAPGDERGAGTSAENFAAYIGSKQSAELQREIRRQEKELAADAENGKWNWTPSFKKLYEDSVLGRITTEQFQMLSGSYTERAEPHHSRYSTERE